MRKHRDALSVRALCGGGGGGADDLRRRRVCPGSFLRAANYGSRVPVDTTPGPAPVCRAPKTHPSAHHQDDELPTPRNVSTSATVVVRPSPPRRHPCNSLNPNTRTSITMSTCNWGISMVCKTMRSRVCATTGVSTPQADVDLKGPSPPSRRKAVKSLIQCRLTQCMYSLLNQAQR